MFKSLSSSKSTIVQGKEHKHQVPVVTLTLLLSSCMTFNRLIFASVSSFVKSE